MDTVILAAGRGRRLNGVTAPFHKPLLVVNGKPILTQAVMFAHQLHSVRVVVVAAPENALPISQVLSGAGFGTADIILQRAPLGPGHALHQGLKLCVSNDVLVLMGDNVSTFADVQRVASMESNAVGISLLNRNEAEPFTRIRTVDSEKSTWVEKVPVTANDLTEHGMAACWVGPLKVDRLQMTQALHRYMLNDKSGEVPIGPFFNELNPATVNVSTFDIGIPEALA